MKEKVIKRFMAALLIWGMLASTSLAYVASDLPEAFPSLGHSKGVYSVAFSPDGRLALMGSDDNTLRLWDVSTGKEIRTFAGHTSWVTSVTFSPDGRLA